MVTFKGKKIADIGFYINLDKRTDRKIKIENQLEEFNIKGVNRFSAISNGDSGPTNCKRSHYKIFEDFIKTGLDTLLILEDDCLFLDFLKKDSDDIFNNINNLEWDLFWLGCRNRREPILYKNKCYKVSSVSHTQSYLIKKNFVKHILDTYPIYPSDKHRTTSIDELLCLSIYGYDVVKDPNKYNFYNLSQPLKSLETKFISLCYEKALTTQYSSYSDLWDNTSNLEEYLINSHPKK